MDCPKNGNPLFELKKIISNVQFRNIFESVFESKEKEINRQKSKVGSSVEHAFGFTGQTMGGMIFRWVGFIM